jgi:hypothetical protein
MWKKLKDFVDDTRAEITVGKVILMAIALFIMAAILPSAISDIEGANTTGWGEGTKALWGILALIAIVVIVLYMLPSWVRKR